MILGDASREGLLICQERFGSYLKSDFVQLSHHGKGSGGSPEPFYRYVDADVVFCPGTSFGAAEKWAADQADALYTLEDGTVTLVLPSFERKEG